MKRYLILLLMWVLVLSFPACSGLGDFEEHAEFQQFVLDEVNFARTDPSGYADERLDPVTDQIAYDDLKNNREPMDALSSEPLLNIAAEKYAQFLAIKNKWGHYEDGTPQERCEREGYYNYSGENIAAGTSDSRNALLFPEEAAIEFVRQWINSEGHRENIYGTSHKKLGVGFGRDENADYINYAVKDFGSV